MNSGSNIIFPLIAILFLLDTGSIRADVVAELLNEARTGNADILKARAEFQAALARVPQARSLPNPAVELETMGADSIGSEQTVRLAQAFPWPGTLGQRESAASLQARSYWHEIQDMELRVMSRIRAFATEIAYLQKEAGLIRENLELFKKQEDFLEQTARGGGEVSDLVRVEMEAGLLGDDLARIQEMIAREVSRLEALVGKPISGERVGRIRMPSGSALPEDPKSLPPKLEATNPILQALASRVDAARAGVSVARLETRPDFMVSAGYRRVNEPGMGGGGEWMNEAVVMVSIGLPIWGQKNQGVRDEASALLEAALQEHESAKRMLRAELQVLLSRGRDATRRAGLFRDQLLPKARQAHESVESSYRTGKASLLDVFDSRRRLLQTETGYWRALADSHVNRAEIDALFGTEIHLSKP